MTDPRHQPCTVTGLIEGSAVGTPWVEPVAGSTNFIPVRPNALGENDMANQAAAVLRARLTHPAPLCSGAEKDAHMVVARVSAGAARLVRVR